MALKYLWECEVFFEVKKELLRHEYLHLERRPEDAANINFFLLIIHSFSITNMNIHQHSVEATLSKNKH
ncbi:CLUMA_CG006652, isoform A [Clunio marinus]|uniref:CLUMA_CG006652, isoform A n=1 Tax=Clunio marinus TaxID=568069 RepID=A0A1J1I2S5_9DIPT|nr:CLUMA_CG006652, isoform A [Clunio marinus]